MQPHSTRPRRAVDKAIDQLLKRNGKVSASDLAAARNPPKRRAVANARHALKHRPDLVEVNVGWGSQFVQRGRS